MKFPKTTKKAFLENILELEFLALLCSLVAFFTINTCDIWMKNHECNATDYTSYMYELYYGFCKTFYLALLIKNQPPDMFCKKKCS